MSSNKKYLISIVIIALVGIFCASINAKIQYEKYMTEYNKVIYEIVGKINEKYPEVSNEELIDILNNKGNIAEEENLGKNILQTYGITENEVAILSTKKIYKNNVILNIILVLAITLSFILILLIHKKREKKEIDKIIEYIREINRKNYELKIKENGEDELTNLRNELYKITLMLKEQAENSEIDKINLAKSLQDISHQIKTPLTSISIMLDEIKENPNMEENIKLKFIYEISRQVEQVKFLTISLLKFSKLDADAVKFECEKINLKMLIEEVTKNLEIPLEIKNQNLLNTIDKDIYVMGDYRWTLEAINNIVKNCIEHTKENKNIYITAKKTNMYVELNIKDEGEGISEKDLKHIFERFYKGKNSNEDSFGIGLSLSKSILEKQNATIKCLSKEKEGTTFKIKFYD